MFISPGTLTGLMDITETYVDTNIWSEIGTSVNYTWCFYRLCQCYKHWQCQSIYYNVIFREHVYLPFKKRINLLQDAWCSKMLIQWMMKWEWLDKLENICQHLKEDNNITKDYWECLSCTMSCLLIYTLFRICTVTLNKYYFK